MRKSITRSLVCIVVLHLAGCGSQSGNETWRENVKLESGETLRIVREETAPADGPLTYARIEFDYKGVHHKWESKNQVPRVLEIDKQGRPVIASSIVYEWAWRQRGSPCDRGVVEYFEHGSWHQIPSWELSVSNFMNLAANKERAKQGIAFGAEVGKPTNSHWDHKYFEKKCDKKSFEDSSRTINNGGARA